MGAGASWAVSTRRACLISTGRNVINRLNLSSVVSSTCRARSVWGCSLALPRAAFFAVGRGAFDILNSATIIKPLSSLVLPLRYPGRGGGLA